MKKVSAILMAMVMMFTGMTSQAALAAGEGAHVATKKAAGSYTVIFDYNTNEIAFKIVDEGATVEKPADPTREGYVFAGWYADEAFSEAFDFNTQVNKNLILYAKWTKLYTVVFDTNGGSSVASQVVEEGSKSTKPANPTKAGYTFIGWYADSAFSTAFDFEAAIVRDTTVYAKWQRNQYTVKFETSSGSAIATQVVENGNKATKPADPTKTGYTFAGWYADSAFSTAFDFDAAITQDTTVYAKWQKNRYTVTFDTNGGSTVAPQVVEENSKAAKPADPTREGYTFAGWYVDSVFSIAYDFDAEITQNTTIYANWAATPKCIVTFDTNGGSRIASQIVEEGGKATKPADPTKTGYTFAGWYADNTFATAFDFDAAIMQETTVYAKWTGSAPQQYIVTFDTNGGSPVSSQSVKEGNKATKPGDPTKAGYTFAGWYADSAFTTAFDFNAAISQTTTVYAKWAANQKQQYTVTFDTNGGSSVASQLVEEGGKTAKPADPRKTGYTFAGWYADSAFTTAFDFEAAIAQDTTAYAKWQKNQYTVKFNTNGGSKVASQVVEEDGKATKPADPTRAGYTFAGWYANSAFTAEYNFAMAVVQNITIYAKWTASQKQQYTVTFDTNGGSLVASQVVEKGGKITKPANPTRAGYKFAGWYTSSALTTLFNFNKAVSSNTTVYAKWTATVKVTSFKVTSTKKKVAKLTWKTNVSPSKIVVYGTKSSSKLRKLATLSGTKKSYQVKGLVSKKRYQFQIAVLDGSTTVAVSAAKTVKVK